jgi:dTDP-glucose 4,6-dehydratase
MTASAGEPRVRRAVVTGGAGFVGSHLCDRLEADGVDVVAIDSLLTGREANIAHLLGTPRFELRPRDVVEPFEVDPPVDAVFHLASPASPVDYARHPIETLDAGSIGTRNALEVAARHHAVFVLASTSEVYGDPLVHPQHEGYHGNVDPVGPRSCYDEAKRFAEALTVAFARARGVRTRIARIFNTAGPRMRLDDGRLLPNLIGQALSGEPMTVHGDGTQSRSIGYVGDTVDALVRLASSSYARPVNVGNPEERSVLEIVRLVASAIGTEPSIRFVERPPGDPEMRCPDIAVAVRELGWRPRVSVEATIAHTVEWFRTELHPARSA